MSTSHPAFKLEEIHERRVAAFKILKKTFWAVKKLDHIHLQPADLRNLNVQLSSFNLQGGGHGDAVSSGLQFFDPKPKHEMDALPQWDLKFHTPEDDGHYEVTTIEAYGNFSNKYLSRPLNNQVIDHGPWAKKGRPAGIHPEGTLEFAFGRPGHYTWSSRGPWTASETEYPHQIIHTLHYMPPTKETEQTITRGELTSLVAFITARMMKVVFQEHEVYPILMLSFFTTKVRVLQAYFDGQVLQVHKSGFVDIGTETNFLKRRSDLTRWMVGKPAGDTKTQPIRRKLRTL